MTALSLVRLTRRYEPGVSAVADLDLDASSGELLVLLGPSGCGKTTTLRLVAGLLPPTAGDILFDGRSVRPLPPEQRGAVMVFQQNSLFPFMSIGDNVAFGLKMRRLDQASIRRRVAEALAAVQLPGFEARWPDQLSGGQRQRVALARALVIRPRLLLLDEPLSNLDRALREELRRMIRQLQQAAGITTLFVTHDQTEAVAIGDRIALMFDGRLRQLAPPRTFFEQPADGRVARFFGSGNILPGVKRDRTVQTAIGPLTVPPTPLADGPVLWTIRPEAVVIGHNGYNSFPATVRDCDYQGQLARYQTGIGATRLQVVAPPYPAYPEGAKVMIHLPRERIWLMPPEAAAP